MSRTFSSTNDSTFGSSNPPRGSRNTSFGTSSVFASSTASSGRVPGPVPAPPRMHSPSRRSVIQMALRTDSSCAKPVIGRQAAPSDARYGRGGRTPGRRQCAAGEPPSGRSPATREGRACRCAPGPRPCWRADSGRCGSPPPRAPARSAHSFHGTLPGRTPSLPKSSLGWRRVLGRGMARGTSIRLERGKLAPSFDGFPTALSRRGDLASPGNPLRHAAARRHRRRPCRRRRRRTRARRRRRRRNAA